MGTEKDTGNTYTDTLISLPSVFNTAIMCESALEITLGTLATRHGNTY